jgi:hypothetical protein
MVRRMIIYIHEQAARTATLGRNTLSPDLIYYHDYYRGGVDVGLPHDFELTRAMPHASDVLLVIMRATMRP